MATTGPEGLAVLRAGGLSSGRVFVQASGEALRVTAEHFLRQASREGPLRRLMRHYQNARLITTAQLVACNVRHTALKRSCRWLLAMHDRMPHNHLPLTHELLASMLGVRRAGVTAIVDQLRERGLISTRRGKITVVDRAGLEAASCECY